MDRRQRWLGYLAIGLGVLALFAALPRRDWHREIRIEAPPRVMAAPAPPPGAFFHEEGPRFGGGPWMHHGRHGGPGFLIDGLVKLAMIFVLVALGLRLLRGGRGPWGPPWRYGPPPWHEHAPPPPWSEGGPPPPAPPAGDGPRTGPTARL